MTPRMLVIGTSVNFWPGTAWIGAAAGGAADGTSAGFAETDTFSRSLAVMDPSNPEPRDTEANAMPFSAANLRANGDANTLSEFVVPAEEDGAENVYI